MLLALVNVLGISGVTTSLSVVGKLGCYQHNQVVLGLAPPGAMHQQVYDGLRFKVAFQSRLPSLAVMLCCTSAVYRTPSNLATSRVYVAFVMQ